MDISQVSINKYNTYCLHYELIANSCYEVRKKITIPTDPKYLPYIIAALMTFDMKQYMGKSGCEMYDPSLQGFARRLTESLNKIKIVVNELEGISLSEIDLEDKAEVITCIYNELSRQCNLHNKGKAFHVGATKIMHFLYPDLFPMIDSNVASVLRVDFNIDYKNTTTPGYSAIKYIESMKAIKKTISDYGIDEFKQIEEGTPLTRIFDKLAFVQGSNL